MVKAKARAEGKAKAMAKVKAEIVAADKDKVLPSIPGVALWLIEANLALKFIKAV